jgi:hypothetical protein
MDTETDPTRDTAETSPHSTDGLVQAGDFRAVPGVGEANITRNSQCVQGTDDGQDFSVESG